MVRNFTYTASRTSLNYENYNNWWNQFDIRLHHHSRQTVQLYSPGGANVPSHEDTLVPPDKYNWICASLGPSESTTQMANRTVQPFLHSSCRKSLYFTMSAPFPPKIALPMGDLDPHLIRDSFGPSKPKIQTHLDRFSCFCTDDCRVSLYFTIGRPFSTNRQTDRHWHTDFQACVKSICRLWMWPSVSD